MELKPAASSDNAELQVGVRGPGKIWLDQVSLMPESWRQAGGYRPDLLQAIAGLRPPVIRWPGGCFASPYRWKDGIGPQHKRGPHPSNMWDDKEVNSFGTDEFVAMCRRVGAEPLIVDQHRHAAVEPRRAWTTTSCKRPSIGSSTATDRPIPSGARSGRPTATPSRTASSTGRSTTRPGTWAPKPTPSGSIGSPRRCARPTRRSSWPPAAAPAMATTATAWPGTAC